DPWSRPFLALPAFNCAPESAFGNLKSRSSLPQVRRLAQKLDQLFAGKGKFRAVAARGSRIFDVEIAGDTCIVKISAGLAACIRFQITCFLSYIYELFDGVFRQVVGPAKSLGEDRDSGSVLKRFQSVKCLPQIVAIGDRPVIRHQKSIV